MILLGAETGVRGKSSLAWPCDHIQSHVPTSVIESPQAVKALLPLSQPVGLHKQSILDINSYSWTVEIPLLGKQLTTFLFQTKNMSHSGLEPITYSGREISMSDRLTESGKIQPVCKNIEKFRIYWKKKEVYFWSGKRLIQWTYSWSRHQLRRSPRLEIYTGHCGGN